MCWRIQAAGDAKEIVLTGVHLGSWGQDLQPRIHLRGLVLAILQETGAPRLRLSSLEPWDLEEDFFSLWEDARLCPHLHLPLQSGSAATLRRMARKTTPTSFAALVHSPQVLPFRNHYRCRFPGRNGGGVQGLEFVRQVGFAEAMSLPIQPAQHRCRPHARSGAGCIAQERSAVRRVSPSW
jgi:threonylcarbamoyladenosine tRNA methylthiotransferase MtaB